MTKISFVFVLLSFISKTLMFVTIGKSNMFLPLKAYGDAMKTCYLKLLDPTPLSLFKYIDFLGHKVKAIRQKTPACEAMDNSIIPNAARIARFLDTF